MEEKKKIIHITFDLDFFDYLNGIHLDEMEFIFNTLQTILERYSEIKTTWFIRIDSQIEQIKGSCDFYYKLHIDKINWLKEKGHCVGWHHHSFLLNEQKNWIQNVNEARVLKEIEKYGEVAILKGMAVCRMGWGFQTNRTMKLLSDMGFKVDSTAIPRPQYKWDLAVKDWTTTGQLSYYPSIKDYRVVGSPSLKIMEVPINTTMISISTDTEPRILRNLNPAYYRKYFINGYSNLQYLDRIVTITHPYELLKNKKEHPLIAFNSDEFIENIKFLLKKDIYFATL